MPKFVKYKYRFLLEESPYEIGREVGMGLDTIPEALGRLKVTYSNRKVTVSPDLLDKPTAYDLYWADKEGNFIAEFSQKDLEEFERGIRDWLREWRQAMVMGRFGRQMWPSTESRGNPGNPGEIMSREEIDALAHTISEEIKHRLS